MIYRVTATPCDVGWELHIQGVGVTQCETLATAEDDVRDYLALLYDVEEITDVVELRLGDPARPDQNEE